MWLVTRDQRERQQARGADSSLPHHFGMAGLVDVLRAVLVLLCNDIRGAVQATKGTTTKMQRGPCRDGSDLLSWILNDAFPVHLFF